MAGMTRLVQRHWQSSGSSGTGFAARAIAMAAQRDANGIDGLVSVASATFPGVCVVLLSYGAR